MERALARWPWPQLLGRAGAPAREPPYLVSGWPSFARKDVQKEDDTPFWAGLRPPGHAAREMPGPSPEGGHFALSPSIGNEILSGRKISRHIFPAGENHRATFQCSP